MHFTVKVIGGKDGSIIETDLPIFMLDQSYKIKKVKKKVNLFM